MEDMNVEYFPDIQYNSSVSHVFIVGFRIHQRYRLILFFTLMATYHVTLFCNLLIIMLVFFSKLSHSPMYVLLSNLSLSEILLTTNIVPPMLHILLRNGAVFSLVGCFTQFSLFGVTAVAESFLLAVMSYDRFLAICRPLHYTMIMSPRLCLCLILLGWIMGFLVTTIVVCAAKTLYFCRANIDHFYCDIIPILKLSCSDTSTVVMTVCSLSSSVTVLPFFVIIATYGFIIRSIARISSSVGKQKAFSTCSSHLGVVLTHYTTMIIVYVVPSGNFMTANKLVSLLYTVLTPLLNPFIYTLRNQEINAAIRQTLASLRRSKGFILS